MSKRKQHRETKKRRTAPRAGDRVAGEAMKAAGEIGSIVGVANLEDTGEMRGVLERLLQTEETLNNIARRYIKS